MKPISCKVCEWDSNGWCNYYKRNSEECTEICPKCNFDDDADLECIIDWIDRIIADNRI